MLLKDAVATLILRLFLERPLSPFCAILFTCLVLTNITQLASHHHTALPYTIVEYVRLCAGKTYKKPSIHDPGSLKMRTGLPASLNADHVLEVIDGNTRMHCSTRCPVTDALSRHCRQRPCSIACAAPPEVSSQWPLPPFSVSFSPF